MKETFKRIINRLNKTERNKKIDDKLARKAIRDARRIVDEFNIDGELGLKSTSDKYLITCFLAQRILKIERRNLFVLQRYFELSSRNNLANFAGVELSLRFLDKLVGEYINVNYDWSGGVNLAASLDNAINILVINSTLTDSNGKETINVTKDKIREWRNQVGLGIISNTKIS